MATFGELKTRVSTRLKDPNNVSISASDVATVINDSIQYYKKKKFWFNEFQETATLAVDNPVLTITTDHRYVFRQGGVVINYSSSRWPLTQISPLQYDQINVEGRGIPYLYTYRNKKVEVYWYPDRAYDVEVYGVKDYSRFAEDGSDDSLSNDFTDDGSDLIMYEALARMYGERRQDPKMETYYAARALNEYKALKDETRARQRTGRYTSQEGAIR